MNASRNLLFALICTLTTAPAAGVRAEDTLVFAHGVVSSGATPYSELYQMDDEDVVDDHSRISSSWNRTPTATAGGFGLWYHARINHQTGMTELLRSTSAGSMGNKVYEVANHRIDALAIGDFGSGPRLIVGMNSGNGGSVVWSFTTGTRPSWQPLYGYNYSREISALAAADFDGDGDDDIAYGFNLDAGGAIVEVADFRHADVQVALQLPAGYKVTALTGGNYNGTSREDLISAISYRASGYFGSSIWHHQGGTSWKWPISGWDGTRVVDSMATGDFLGTAEPHEELVVGFVNHWWNATTRYSGDGWNLTSHPIVRDLPSSYCSRNEVCHWNSRMLVAPHGH